MDKIKPIKLHHKPDPKDLDKQDFNFLAGAINRDIEHLNALIKNYNKATGDNKVTILWKIEAYRNQVIARYPPYHFNKFPTIATLFQNDLFVSIKKALKKQNIYSMYPISKTEQVKAQTLVEFITNMDPDKASQLATLLANPKYHSKANEAEFHNFLSKIYSSKEKPEYSTFKQLLRDYKIEYLGGINSSNFKIVNSSGSIEQILKVNDVLNPSFLNDKLEQVSSNNPLTKVHLNRQTTFKDPKKDSQTLTKTIVIMEYCSNGNLITHGNQFHGKPTERISSAISLYKQMAELLKDMNKAEIAFPDMKNSNWLIDEHGKLKIADTKSFFPTHKGVMKHPTAEDPYFLAFFYSEYMYPNEFKTKNDGFDADKMHAYMLGKNLYQYMTGADATDLNSGLLFNLKIFITPPVGQELKALIENLTQDNPENRMSVDNALNELNRIELLKQQAELTQQQILAKQAELENHKKQAQAIEPLKDLLTNQINSLRIITKTSKGQLIQDEAMDNYIKEMMQHINIIKGPEQITAIQIELLQIKTTLESSDARAITNRIAKLRKGAHTFGSIGKNKKADAIEFALAKVPLKDRDKIFDMKNQDPKIIAVRQALAVHRYGLHPAGYHLKKADPRDVHEHHAARSFKKLHKEYKERHAKQESPLDPDNQKKL